MRLNPVVVKGVCLKKGKKMFSIRQKREISEAIQKILRDTNHPELPEEGVEIEFCLHVRGSWEWSWADIKNNGDVPNPSVNPHNEGMDYE